MSRDDKTDERIGQIVLETLQGRVEDAEGLAKAIADALIPTLGVRAMRRRAQSQLMSAFREGFLGGRFAGRMGRWHAQIWRESQSAKAFRDSANPQAAAHFEKYNF